MGSADLLLNPPQCHAVSLLLAIDGDASSHKRDVCSATKSRGDGDLLAFVTAGRAVIRRPGMTILTACIRVRLNPRCCLESRGGPQVASQLCGLPFKPGAVLAAHHSAEESARVRAFPLLAAPPRLLSLLHRGKSAAVNDQPGRLTVRLEGSADPPDVRAPTGPADPVAASRENPAYRQLPFEGIVAASSLLHRSAAMQRPDVTAVEATGTTSPEAAEAPVADSGGGNLWAALHSTAAQSAPREQADCGTSPRPLHLSPPPVCTAAASAPQAVCRRAGHSLAAPAAVRQPPQPADCSRPSSSSSLQPQQQPCGVVAAFEDVGTSDAATHSGGKTSTSTTAAYGNGGAPWGRTAAVPTHAQPTDFNAREASLPASDGTSRQPRQPTSSQAAADSHGVAAHVHTSEAAAAAQEAPGMLPLPAWQPPEVGPRDVSRDARIG